MATRRPIDPILQQSREGKTPAAAARKTQQPAPRRNTTSRTAGQPPTASDRVKRVPSRQKPPATTPRGTAAKRKTPPPAPPRTREKERPAPGQEREKGDAYIWIGLVLIFIAGLLAISTISYLFYWDVDQNVASWSTLFRDVHQDALNWGGRLGAILSDYIIGRWFGLFGELLPVVVLLIALKVLRVIPLRFHRAVSSTLLLMIVGSVAAGHFLGADPRVFGSGWGGTHGIFIARWLEAMIGQEGTSLLLVLALLGVLYYAFQQPVRKTVRSVREYIRKREQLARERRELRTLEMRRRMEELRAAALAAPEVDIPAEAEHSRAPVETDARAASPQPARPAPVHTDTIEPDTGYWEAEPVPTPSRPASPAYVSTADRSRLIGGPDGSWGYLMGYDDSGEEVIYLFDRAAWAEMRSYSLPGAEAGEPAEPEPLFTVGTRTEQEPAVAEQPTTVPLSNVPESKEALPAAAAPDEQAPGFIVEQPEEEQLVDDATINSEGLYDPTLELSSYKKPPVELLEDHTQKVVVTDEELVENKNRILTTLENFGIRIDTIEATIGPTVTLYEIIPAPGVRISKIKNLEDDIALSLSALGIRIIAPIPGKGTIGIEVPNKNKEVVSMYSVIKSPHFYNSGYDLPVALGKTIQNETFVFDLAKMPHLLVAGATGQGKSVGLNAIITSLLYKKHPAELKFVLVDPKKVELTLYSRLEKHFLAKMPDADEAIITDTQKVIFTLNSLCIEMDARYDLLKTAKVRNIKEYNEKFINRRLNPEKGHRYLPYFVVIVDEFADLIMTAGREIETPIARIAQLARAVGIHLIIATQRPTTNIITGVIKANFPARIAFRVTSMIDSRTILDQPGANQLIGRGDMLISTGSEVTRVQCAFIDTPEVERITDHIGNQRGYLSAYELPEYTPETEESGGISGDVLTKRDSLFEEVARYVVNNQMGSASTIQRKFSIGFNRAGRIVDQLEAAGIVGRSEGGGKPRQVLVSDPVSLDSILDNLS